VLKIAGPPGESGIESSVALLESRGGNMLSLFIVVGILAVAFMAYIVLDPEVIELGRFSHGLHLPTHKLRHT